MTDKVVNITQTASGQRLKDDLDKEAKKRGMKVRSFVGQILTYAVANKSVFKKPLKDARPKPGDNIGAVVSEKVIDELNAWAKEKNTSRGFWCCFILEKVLEDRLIDDIFSS